MFQPAFRRVVVALVGALALLAPALPAVAATASAASTIGVVPPQDPTSYCAPDLAPIDAIDYCRAQEGVGPIVLPDNYDTLTPQEQMLVVFNLERVNRGLLPVVGLSTSLDGYAQQGADVNDDPPFPPEGGGGGAIWDANDTTLDADDAFMYTDDCTPSNVVGCWGHREIILIDYDTTDPLVGGGGFTPDGWRGQLNSYTFEVLYAYPATDLYFTWADELADFAVSPTTEPLQPPTVTGVTSVLSTAGGAITVHGTDLVSTTSIDVGGVPATHLRCPNETTCTAMAPAHTAGTAAVQVTAAGGTSQPGPQAQLTYALPVLTRVGGRHRSVRVGHKVSRRFTVRLTAGGVPMAGVPVTFVTSHAAHFRGGNGTRAVEVTGSGGKARSPRLLAGYRPKRATVTARVPGAAAVRWKVRIHR